MSVRRDSTGVTVTPLQGLVRRILAATMEVVNPTTTLTSVSVVSATKASTASGKWTSVHHNLALTVGVASIALSLSC